MFNQSATWVFWGQKRRDNEIRERRCHWYLETETNANRRAVLISVVYLRRMSHAFDDWNWLHFVKRRSQDAELTPFLRSQSELIFAGYSLCWWYSPVLWHWPQYCCLRVWSPDPSSRWQIFSLLRSQWKRLQSETARRAEYCRLLQKCAKLGQVVRTNSLLRNNLNGGRPSFSLTNQPVQPALLHPAHSDWRDYQWHGCYDRPDRERQLTPSEHYNSRRRRGRFLSHGGTRCGW